MKTRAFVRVFVMSALLGAPAWSQIYPKDDVIAWYEPFGYIGETANPRAVRMIETGNDGASSGGVSVAAGMVGTAFQFDGVDARVDVPDLGLFDPFDFTIEAWVYYDPDANPNQRNYIVSQGDPFAQPSSTGWALMTDGDGIWHLHFDGSPLYAAPFLRLPERQWTHIALTREVATLRYYQNTPGQPFGAPSNRSTSLGTSGSGPIRIGNSAAGGQRFGGKIDELTIYSRALAAWEIEAIFLAGSFGKEKPTPSEPLLLCWSFGFSSNIGFSTHSDHATQMVWYYTGAQGAGIVPHGYPTQYIARPSPGIYDLFAIAMNDHGSDLGRGCFVRNPPPVGPLSGGGPGTLGQSRSSL